MCVHNYNNACMPMCVSWPFKFLLVSTHRHAYPVCECVCICVDFVCHGVDSVVYVCMWCMCVS